MDLVKLSRGRLPVIGRGEIDVTVKTSLERWRAFAPDWELVLGHKRGEISHAEYTHAYREALELSAANGELPVQELHAQGIEACSSLILCCYCKMIDWCHTHVLISWLCEKYPALFEDGRP